MNSLSDTTEKRLIPVNLLKEASTYSSIIILVVRSTPAHEGLIIPLCARRCVCVCPEAEFAHGGIWKRVCH